MKHLQPELPYALDALEPYISKETMNYHYGKHHAGYIAKLNDMIVGTEFEDIELEDIVKTAPAGGIFNNRAQTLNHTMYFMQFTPNSSKLPTGKISDLIDVNFGSFDEFKAKFDQMAVSNFGSGWTWLIQDDSGKLEIINTDDAGAPLTQEGRKILLTCDVWEHAYYLDTRNSRPEYLKNFWEVIDWDVVESRLG